MIKTLSEVGELGTTHAYGMIIESSKNAKHVPYIIPLSHRFAAFQNNYWICVQPSQSDFPEYCVSKKRKLSQMAEGQDTEAS